MNAKHPAPDLVERLNNLDRLADAPADKAVADLVEKLFKDDERVIKGDRAAVLPDLMQSIGRNPGDLEPDVATFLNGGSELDQLIAENRARIEHAQEFFDDNGVAIIAALFHASLPEAYLGVRGVQVLDMTGELFRNWTRRVQETGHFLINVLSPAPELGRDGRSSLSPGEYGAQAARRVRLIHAAIRWRLLGDHRPPPGSLLFENRADHTTVWDARMIEIGREGEAGGPLNQEDLLATLGTFTTVVFCALERLAVPFTKEDRDAFYFLWNVVAWHMGIGDADTLAAITQRKTAWPKNALLPIEADDMDPVYRDLAEKLQKESEQGRRMTKALLQELAYPLPRVLQGFPAFLARYFIGDKHANALDIEQGGYVELLLTGSGALDRLAQRARSKPERGLTIKLATELVTRYALRTFVAQSRWSERGLKIDKRIAAKWGVQVPPEPGPPSRP
jgi:ER-bound oxygenase mpaB/B'/Rubber oxygenase, catalytic domain